MAAKALADNVWMTLNRPNLASFSSSTVDYVRIQPTQSGPIFLGENDVEQPEWSINVRLESLITLSGVYDLGVYDAGIYDG